MAVQKKQTPVRKTLNPITRKKITEGRVLEFEGGKTYLLKGGKRVPVGQRNNSFFPPKENIEVVNGMQEDFIKIDRGTLGPKLAESIIELFSYLSLSQRNEVIELVLTKMCITAIEETNRKRQVYEESQTATEELHGLLTGTLMNKPQAKNSVPSHS